MYFVFSREPFGDGRYRLWQAAEDTIAVGSIILECPTADPGISQIESNFQRGVGGQSMAIQWGSSGPISEIIGRAIAVDTDAEPWSMFPVMIDIPDRIITAGLDGYSGVGMTYLCYV